MVKLWTKCKEISKNARKLVQMQKQMESQGQMGISTPATGERLITQSM